MFNWRGVFRTCFVCGFLFASQVLAEATEAYEGKTIRIVVGAAAGGGLDVYARALARHIPKHIPGKPTIVVDNMPGGGGLIAAKFVNRAKPDGLTIGHWIGSFIQAQVLQGVTEEIDFQKFEWMGSPVPNSVVCAFTKASGITSVEKWFAAETPIKMGGFAPGTVTSNIIRILKEALGLPIQLVEGYRGTAPVRLAMEAGEVAGSCWDWSVMKSTWAKMIESGDILILLQTARTRHSELPKVPNAIELAKTQDARQLIESGIHIPSAIDRLYSLPPGTPKTHVMILRKAFESVMKDPDYLSEAKKSNLGVDPLSGDEVQKLVSAQFKLDPNLKGRLRTILFPGNP